MARGFDVVCEQPMSEDLYYKLTNFFIPIIAKNTKTFHSIKLTAKTLPAPHFNGNAVGTGLSCGVDSLNTVQKYIDFPIQKYKLTHLVFLNNGALGSRDYLETVKVFEEEKLHIEKAAKEIGLPLLAINTNMVELYSEIQTHRANNNEGLKIASVIYALRKLFSVYFIASSFSLDLFKFSDHDVGFFAPFTANMLSSDIEFIIGDLEFSRRIDKIIAIADNAIAQKYIHVNPVKNCGRCGKCLRTLLELDVIGKLDSFKQSFNVEKFRYHKIWNMIRYFSIYKEYDFHYPQEIIAEGKNRGKRIPFFIFPAAFLWLVLRGIKQCIKRLLKLANPRQI